MALVKNTCYMFSYIFKLRIIGKQEIISLYIILKSLQSLINFRFQLALPTCSLLYTLGLKTQQKSLCEITGRAPHLYKCTLQ